MYNMNFKITRHLKLHFSKQPKIQHGVKATSFPESSTYPAADTIFNGLERDSSRTSNIKPDPWYCVIKGDPS
jgi:hypothetical protein